jgi:hypothetical protein
MRANVEAKHSFRGHVARVGGALAGIVLACAVQPAASYTHTQAAEHSKRYDTLIHSAGIYFGYDTDGEQPGDRQLIERAHAEWNRAEHWQYGTLAIEGGALVLLATGVITGGNIARREEQAAAAQGVATQVIATGE